MGPPVKSSTAVVLLIRLLRFLLAAALPLVSAKLKTSTIQFDYFNDTYDLNKTFQVDSPATINNDTLQVTLDSVNSSFPFINQSGRILYKTPFKLWEGQNDAYSDRVASFNVSFLVNLNRVGNFTPGEGLAFVVAPDLNLPPNSYGEYLGLTNSTTDGDATNRLIAVELDTFKEDFDPDSNHVGLDINSVRSNTTASLTPFGVQLVGDGTTANFFNVWVQYDGVNKVIEVYIAHQVNKTDPTPSIPNFPILTSNLELRGIVKQYSYFGFSASTSNVAQLNRVLHWSLTIEYYYDEKRPLVKIGQAAGILVVVLLVVVLLTMVAVMVSYFRKWIVVCYSPMWISSQQWNKRLSGEVESIPGMISSQQWNMQLSGEVESIPGMVREYPFKELAKATNNFDPSRILGQGGFGSVYKGILTDQGDLKVAVKMFSRNDTEGQDDFLAELKIIILLRHRNLVELLGRCHYNGKLLLVYDYMPNGSLDKHLYSDVNSKPLRWELRHKIISGVASALQYLHYGFTKMVIHRDLKPSNIMLDSDFNAKLGDFGLARAIDKDKTSWETRRLQGTMGYMAPECLLTGKSTGLSDVYAFGAVMLEVVCGFKPGTRIDRYQFLVDWVWALHCKGQLLEAVDKKLGEDYVVEEAQRILLLGLACSHPTARERPKIHEIVQILSGSMAVPRVPPFKPAFVWTSGPLDNSPPTIPNTNSLTNSHNGSGWSPFAMNPETQRPYSDT